jgi:hypothetical protein
MSSCGNTKINGACKVTFRLKINMSETAILDIMAGHCVNRTVMSFYTMRGQSWCSQGVVSEKQVRRGTRSTPSMCLQTMKEGYPDSR